MKTQSEVLADIESFLAATGMKTTMFGVRVANNGKLVERMRAGGEMTHKTIVRIESFLARCEVEGADAVANIKPCGRPAKTTCIP